MSFDDVITPCKVSAPFWKAVWHFSLYLLFQLYFSYFVCISRLIYWFIYFIVLFLFLGYIYPATHAVLINTHISKQANKIQLAYMATERMQRKETIWTPLATGVYFLNFSWWGKQQYFANIIIKIRDVNRPGKKNPNPTVIPKSC